MEHQNFYCFEQLSIQTPRPSIGIDISCGTWLYSIPSWCFFKRWVPAACGECNPALGSAAVYWAQTGVLHSDGWQVVSSISDLGWRCTRSNLFVIQRYIGEAIPFRWSVDLRFDSQMLLGLLLFYGGQKWYLPHKDTLGRCPLSAPVFSGLPGGSLGSRGLYEIDPGSVFDPRSSIDRISSALLPPLPPIHTQESLREDELQVGKYSFGVQLVCIFFCRP